MNLCTKEIAKEEDKETSVKSKKRIGSSISGMPYDYYKPAKARRIDDMRIMPAHQGDVNLSPRSTLHLSPTCLMSASTAILKKSSMTTIHATPMRDLSVKHADMKYGDNPAVPSTFSSLSRSPIEGFSKLSLQLQFPRGPIFKFGMQHNFAKTKITPFSLPSEIQKSPILRNRELDDEPTFEKLQKMNPKSKSLNKLQLYREMLAKKEWTDHIMKTRSTTEGKLEAAKEKDRNVSTETMKEETLEKSPRVHGLKIGCTVSRGIGKKCFLGTTHPKKLISKAQSTSKKVSCGTKLNLVKIGKNEPKKIAKINIEKVDDRVLRDMAHKGNVGKANSEKLEKDEDEESKLSNVVLTTKEVETEEHMEMEHSVEHLNANTDKEIQKENKNEVPRNLQSTDNDDASLTFKDLKNSQKTSDESEDSSEPTDSNISNDRGDGGDSKSTCDYEDGGGIDDDIEEEEYEDGEAGDDDEYEEDSKSLNSTKDEVNIEDQTVYKKKVLTSPKSIVSRIKDYTKKIGQEGIKFTSSAPLKNLNIIPQHPNFKFFCAVCGQGFMNKNHYVTHSNMHSDTRTFKCAHCSKAFVTKSGLTRHLKGCQVMTKNFQCTVCGKYFKTKETLGKHSALIHRKTI